MGENIYVTLVHYSAVISTEAGADPRFSFRGGAQQVMCQHAHYEHRTELTFGRGQGPA